MIVFISPFNKQNLYSLMVKKETSLRQKKQGTLHRIGKKKKNEELWGHSSYSGRVKFHKTVGGAVTAHIYSKNAEEEWQILTSFIGFLDRHFRDSISSINIIYEKGTVELFS